MRSHPLLDEHAATLDRAEALYAEDQALRDAEYLRPDPQRRRLRVACNECSAPWCCNQRVDANLLEVLLIYRHAAKKTPSLLEAAIARGKELRARPPEDDVAHFRQKRPCPFLKDGRCGVYAVRPRRCREHYMAGNPLRCRDELAPRETYAMNPDATIVAELARLADDVAFFAELDDAPAELCERLHLVDEIVRRGARWKGRHALGWALVGEPEVLPQRRKFPPRR